jgi:sec-independent protein translocase protein TatC
MPWLAHLAELRKRAFLVACGLVAGAVGGWYAYKPLLAALQAPLKAAAEKQGKSITLNFTGLASALDLQVKAALFLSMILTCPWWLYQLWAFITPGLTKKERRYTIGFLAGGVPLFLAGAGLAWWALPHAVDILSSFVPKDATNFTDAQGYLTFVMRLVIAFGLAFTLPVVLVALNLAGLLKGRTMLRGWRWAIMIAFTFAAVMTPTPDALTMIFVALPICALYFAAVGIGLVHDRRAARRAPLVPGT